MASPVYNSRKMMSYNPNHEEVDENIEESY